MYFSSMTAPDRTSCGWLRIPYCDMVGRLYAIFLTHLTLQHPITTSSTPWKSSSWEILHKYSRLTPRTYGHFCLQNPLVLSQGGCTAGDALAECARCSWRLLRALIIDYICSEAFSFWPLKTTRTSLVTLYYRYLSICSFACSFCHVTVELL